MFMRERFLDAEIGKDIASGLNNQRQGLRSMPGRILRGWIRLSSSRVHANAC
jgi:hypothetical protein